ncbi:MAG: hypothetical protein AB1861_15170 [Cyanobacteriota bacterium]
MRIKLIAKHINANLAKNKIAVIDCFIIVCFALFSLLYFLGRWKGAYPFVFLDGDTANIASFAAAWDHPRMFHGDEVLGNPSNFRFYATIHIPIIRSLAKITGDYGTAFISLLMPHIFLQLLGFYLFGIVLFQSRYWAVLLTIVTSILIWLNLGEYWGIYTDVQPRFSFQALLPYLLAATLYWGRKPSFWPWLMGMVGIFIYIHPVSAPAWIVAIWLGLLALKPASYPFKKAIGYMLVSGAVCLAVTLPWFIHYLDNYAHGSTEHYEQVYDLMKFRFSEGYLDLPLAIQKFVSIVWNKGILPLGIMGAAIVLWLRRKNYSSVLLIGLWLGGLLLASVVIPLIDHAIARAYQLIPVQVDLIRGIRYTVPIMLLFCLWSLAEISKKLNKSRTIVAISGILLVALWTYQHPPTPVLEALSCWRQGQFICMPAEYSETVAGLEAIKRLTPPGSRILPIGATADRQALAIRYYALRPVVYSYKDGGALAYANHPQFLLWYQKYKEVKAWEEEQNLEMKVKKLIELSKKMDFQYCLTTPNINSFLAPYSGKADIVYTNSLLALLKISYSSIE